MRDIIPRWQKILAQGFSSVNDLLAFLNLPETLGAQRAELSFKTRVPRGFAGRMVPEDPNDPLLLQVLASAHELQVAPEYSTDPLEEQQANALSGLLHKYQGRVLLTASGACAVNCRYCFRRHFAYQDNNPGRAGWQRVMAYIAADASIHEVIFSGGDPLLLNDVMLSDLFAQLADIPHVQTIRIHTRLPVVLPERVSHTLLSLFKSNRFRYVMVIHCNHPNELDAAVQRACLRLRQAGVHLLNQSVLLRDVNDSADTLIALSERLFECGVLPYYLHLLDKVQGAAHFDVPFTTARTLFQALRRGLPGYLVPRLAREEPGEPHKTLLM